MTKQQIYDWLLRFSFDVLLIFIFLFIFFHPLLKLSKTRSAMIIVFSRAIGSLLRLLMEMPFFLINNIFCVSPPLLNNLLTANLTIYEMVFATHILALAMNRAHAMNFYLICAFLWLFSLIVGLLDQTMWLLRRWPSASTLFLIIHKICMGIGAFCYAAITCKIIWLKYKSNSTLSNDTTSEKDSVRILIVCFSCLFMSSLRWLVLPYIVPYTIYWSEIPQIIFYWLTFFAVLLSTCTEEICLFFLVREFRNDVKQQFRRIFCCLIKKSSSHASGMNNNINMVTSFSNTRTQINNWTQNN